MAGRPKGSPNKATILESYLGTGKDSGKYLLSVMTDVTAPMAARIDAAGKLLPYQHRRLPATLEVAGAVQVQHLVVEVIRCASK